MGVVKGRRDLNVELNKLHSDKVEERATGLARLTHIVKEKRQNLAQINDTGYHTILESVFHVVKLEASNYVRATKTTRAKVESRLSACAALIRVVVEVGLRKLRYKTVKALVEHVLQTLPTVDGGYCTPLCKDYFKALATLLGFTAHTEHFLGDEWHELVDFCLETARDLNKSDHLNGSGPSNSGRSINLTLRRDNSSRSATPIAVGDHGRISSSAASQHGAYPQIRDSQVDIALCLQSLLSVSNAPIFDRADAVAATIMDLLDSYPKVAAIQQILFECINSIMSRIIVNDVALSLQIVIKVIPNFRRFWDVKDNAMKETLLAFLSFAEALLPRILIEDSHGDRKDELSAIVETLREDYCARRHREQLQLDELSPTDPFCCGLRQVPLSNCTVQLRMGVSRAESAWCLISSSAAIIEALENDTISQERSMHLNEQEYQPKRQRLIHALDEVVVYVKGPVRSTKSYALQVLVFIFDTMRCDEHALNEYLEVLLLCLSDDDGLVASWAMFAMTSDVADLVDGMVRSVDLNGPAEYDDSATNLWTTLLIRKERENLGATPETPENVLRWLFNRWSPGELSMHSVNASIYVCAGRIPDYKWVLADTTLFLFGRRTHHERYSLLSSSELHDMGVTGQLQGILQHISTSLKHCMLHQENRQELLGSFFESFSSVLLPFKDLISGDDLLTNGCITMCRGFDQAFWSGAMQTRDSASIESEHDELELDDHLDMHDHQSRQGSCITEVAHLEFPASTCATAFHACVSAKVCLLSNIDSSQSRETAFRSAIPSFIDYLTALKGYDFLACRAIILEFLEFGPPLLEDDASTLFQYFAAVLLRSYESERSEVSMGLILNAMTDLADLWTNDENREIFPIAKEFYLWFINTVLGKAIASPYVHICMSRMLQTVLKIRPEYGTSFNNRVPTRTSLFQVLRDGNITVKFHVGNDMADTFSLFILKDHERVLNEVIDSLPNDSNWIEGIALRLYVLSHLAASWSSLLRHCTYRVLECPKHVPKSAGYAKSCLTHIATRVGLPDSKTLFKLFLPQVFFTWLERESLSSFPYAILGYSDLPELLQDCQDEIVAQVAMRGSNNDADYLSSELNKPFNELLELCFSKSSAYCIARDIAMAPPKDTQTLAADARLRKIVTKGKYTSLIQKNFPSILVILFKVVEPAAQIERGFEKHPDFAEAHSAYEEIVSKSGPDKELPASQQPVFKSKYLLDEIKYLCHRANYDAGALWTPELYVYVFREIFGSIHEALGSMHACSILRRLRILISIAGNVALKQYPLEMVLHSVRPYLTEIDCAEEAIGLTQYLLERGLPYLREIPSFLAGHAVSTLTSMKAFFDSTQDSITQESQFKATMSRAQIFHTWYSAYLKGYHSPFLHEDSIKSFAVITNAATHMETGGNAKVGTYESELLLEVLEDQRSGRNLLDQSCRDSIMKFLCTSFEMPSNFRDDILGSDEKASQYATILWKTCQQCTPSQSFRLWAGRVLGRAYAGQGLIDQEMINETNFELSSKASSSKEVAAMLSSRANLLKLLRDILHSESSSEVGMAEGTLRCIITKTERAGDLLEHDQCLPSSLTSSLLWHQFHLPEQAGGTLDTNMFNENAIQAKAILAQDFIQKVSVALVLAATGDAILSELPPILQSIDGLPEKAFPYILHLRLLQEADGHQETKKAISDNCQRMFGECANGDDTVIPCVRILLQAVLYLRTQLLPNETSKDDRAQWLEIDYKMAAAAAIKCSMFKTALLFLEVDFSILAKMSRRSSAAKIAEPSDLLLAIYEKIDEQDAFYGVQQPSGLTSMMMRLDYEKAGFRSLSFRGAHYDGQLRLSGDEYQADEESIVQALDSLDLNGLSQSLLNKMTNTGPSGTDSILRTARKLEQWDISAPSAHVSSASTIFQAFQGVSNAMDQAALAASLNTGFIGAMDQLTLGKGAKSAMHEILGSLAILTEADEVFSSRKSSQVFEVVGRFEARNGWMYSESYDHIKGILSCRETALSMLSKNTKLQAMLKTSQRDARSAESQLLLASSQMSRLHGALQNALSTAMYLTQLVQPCSEVGVDISAAVQFETAHVLWGQGEMAASIKMLQDLVNHLGSHTQLAKVGKSELLATLGDHISEARLEKPDEIINRYLVPAIKGLHGDGEGNEAGQVFHEFASFCDQQLQNPDSLEDFHRIEKLRERKEAEVEDLNKMMKTASSQARERENLKSYRNKARAWFELDDREFQRLRNSRETFLRQSLENYLLSLRACDRYDKDALRFSALWLENYDTKIANEAVEEFVGQVASRKFAPLMNQWSSRLLDSNSHFQGLLASLVLRICIDHPYHGMYQIFAGSKSKGGKDEKALARNSAANNIVQQLKTNKRSAATWMAMHNTNILFVRLASERLDDAKQGSRVLLRKSTTGQRVEQDVPKSRVPPPTAKIELRADCNYSETPFIARFQPELSIASGISMPKILTAIGTDGVKYKQLFKGGNDDLRQDSIMEQVFEQVSDLLRTQRSTRQRNLGIRTYKVLPLTASTGIIEFVPDTVPLHDYLLPAHQRHFPKDMKPNNCRKHISDAQSKSVDHRIKIFRQVCDHFHPVLRYFFMERFESPDDWFEKRLAYTRSTAAISILGHILGLGDRHGHNILLDEKTGEVVHIDLGIAFEQGRILPVPEVVPFRLTRDLVDAMGITKTEGVFRRCCEFTLEALRNESYSIMTILDVLRYDPLYSWSVSPLRLKKMQDAQTEDEKIPGNGGGEGVGRGGEAEPGEADRALTVVKKKLSKSLSVQATVNELIQSATDERNLAVLFAGWAAYA
ncbi:Serine/threonine-protein kinase tel1 [Lecanora helva]